MLAKYLEQHKQIVYYSLAWDVLMAIVGIAIPIVFFNMKFSSFSVLGILLIICGIIAIKFGEISS